MPEFGDSEEAMEIEAVKFDEAEVEELDSRHDETEGTDVEGHEEVDREQDFALDIDG